MKHEFVHVKVSALASCKQLNKNKPINFKGIFLSSILLIPPDIISEANNPIYKLKISTALMHWKNLLLSSPTLDCLILDCLPLFPLETLLVNSIMPLGIFVFWEL